MATSETSKRRTSLRVRVPSLPYTSNGVTYTSNQIRKVNISVGVRSERLARQTEASR